MSTRKLIFTALFCGLLIMVAGGVKLFQTVRDGNEVPLLALGESVTLGDMTVRVNGVRVTSDRTLVDVVLIGVDGGSALDGWKLLAGGKITEPVSLPVGTGAECTTTKRDVESICTVAFPVSQGTRTVAYVRAGEQRQWAMNTRP
ncbi:MAG: hypothetical protein ACYC06_08150 [Ilumatobacteraceae bacterium]